MGTRLIACALISTVPLLALGCGGGSGGATNVEIVHDFYRGDPTDDERS